MERSFSDLSSSCKRPINTTLSSLDKVLCEFEELAKGREVHSVLYSENNRLLLHQREELLLEIAALRRMLAVIKEVLRLEGKVQTAEGFIWSRCSGLWTNLAEIESKRLKGYGEAPSGFSEHWDRWLSEAREHLTRIIGVLKEA